jgi:hypothetical protein
MDRLSISDGVNGELEVSLGTRIIDRGLLAEVLLQLKHMEQEVAKGAEHSGAGKVLSGLCVLLF